MRRLVAILFAVMLVGSFVVYPSDVDAYTRCACTAWASQKRRDLPMNLGNALTWGNRAANQGFPVDGKPRVGDVMVLQPGVQGAHRRYGHVAYVVGVNGGKVTVTEMNGGSSCKVYTNVYRVTRGTAFIHAKK